LLLNHDISVDITDNDGQKPLRAAASNVHLEVPRQLLSNDGIVHVARKHELTALLAADDSDQLTVILVAADSDQLTELLAAADSDKLTALLTAADSDQLTAVLAAADSDKLTALLTAVDSDQLTALLPAADSDKLEAFCEFLKHRTCMLTAINKLSVTSKSSSWVT
jgi:Mg/Co/Ni transporter MgtE